LRCPSGGYFGITRRQDVAQLKDRLLGAWALAD
jgi:hypothetical protein